METQEITYLIYFIAIIFFTFLVFVISIVFNYYNRNKKYNNSILELQFKKEQEILQTQIEIQEQTLKTIAQEIHDNIGQVLSLAKLNLNTFPVITDAVTQTKIDDTKQLVSKAISDLRDLSRSLHGDRISELGLEQAIAAELKILQNTGAFQTGLAITGSEYKLDPQQEIVLFRIVQEALNNAIKHSGAKNIDVQLKYEDAVFTIVIADDGAGFNPEALQTAQTGIGLKSMKNRATLIGGDFFVHSDTDKGTSITIEMKTSGPIAQSFNTKP